MDRPLIILMLAAVVTIGILSGGAGMFVQHSASNPNPQSAYVPAPGDCVVMPQGQDAVYDQFYAQQVNPFNCDAYVNQEAAQYTQAQTAALDWKITQSRWGTGSMIVVGLAILAFFVWAIKH